MKKFEDESFWNNQEDIIKTEDFNPKEEFEELDNELYEVVENSYHLFTASENSARNIYVRKS